MSVGYELLLVFLLIYLYSCCFCAENVIVICFSWILSIFTVFVWLVSIGGVAGFLGLSSMLLVLAYFGAAVVLLLFFSLRGAVGGVLRGGSTEGSFFRLGLLGLWALLFCSVENSTDCGGCGVPDWFATEQFYGQGGLVLIELLQDSSGYFLYSAALLLSAAAAGVGILSKSLL